MTMSIVKSVEAGLISMRRPTCYLVRDFGRSDFELRVTTFRLTLIPKTADG